MKKISNKQKERKSIEKAETVLMFQLFLTIWDNRADKDGNCFCFESNKVLRRETFKNLSTCYHHVLAKGKGSYPQYCLTEKNIVILHPDIHAAVEQSIDNCPKIRVYKQELLDLHRTELL